MSGVSLELERNRELLSQAILDILQSWPELYRKVFEKSHYQGHSVEMISGSLGLSVTEVRMILENCDRRLRSALHDFRTETQGAEENPRQRRAPLSIYGCFR